MSGTCSRFAPMYATGNNSQAAVFVSTTVSSTGFMASVTAAPVGGVGSDGGCRRQRRDLRISGLTLLASSHVLQGHREMTPRGYSSSKAVIPEQTATDGTDSCPRDSAGGSS